MITLLSITQIAKNLYPEKEIDFSLLLLSWAESSDMELERYVSKTGITTKKIAKVINKLKLKKDFTDKEILKSCILRKKTSILGKDLLLELFFQENKIITASLVKAGLDLLKLKYNLESITVDLNNEIIEDKNIFKSKNEKPKVKKSPIFSEFGIDLTQSASEGLFEDLYERPDEVNRIIDILMKRNKNSLILTGSSGVGKTALVKVLSKKIIEGNVPKNLLNTKIFEINMGKVVAGTRYRGDFEERLWDIIKLVQANQPAILFIDEIHMILGAGRSAGVANDAANMLKEPLSSGKIKIIGATTVSEYNQYIAKDPALARRFEEVRLKDPDEKLAFNMVKKQAEFLIKHHKVEISDDIVLKSIKLTDRYLPNRQQPDKSIELLDLTSVETIKNKNTKINERLLTAVLSKQSGLPIFSFTDENKKLLNNLNNELKKEISVSNNVLEKVSSVLIPNILGFSSREKNLGSFLFYGNNNENIKKFNFLLSKKLFKNEKSFLYINSSEYRNFGDINKLIGIPIGYLGSENEGIISNWFEVNGGGVIFFDNFDKGNDELKEFITNFLSSGKLVNTQGKIFKTSHCIIVFSCSLPINLNNTNKTIQIMTSEYFSNEFTKLLDDIIYFSDFENEQIRSRLKKELKKSLEILRAEKILVSFDELTLLDYLEEIAKGNLNLDISKVIEKEFIQPIVLESIKHNSSKNIRVLLAEGFYKNKEVLVLGKKYG